jgi:hypothetical protein
MYRHIDRQTDCFFLLVAIISVKAVCVYFPCRIIYVHKEQKRISHPQRVQKESHIHEEHKKNLAYMHKEHKKNLARSKVMSY